MQVELTEVQLKKIIELLRKARIGQTDARLIEYLKGYLNPVKATPINYDEIPFWPPLRRSAYVSATNVAWKRSKVITGHWSRSGGSQESHSYEA